LGICQIRRRFWQRAALNLNLSLGIYLDCVSLTSQLVLTFGAGSATVLRRPDMRQRPVVREISNLLLANGVKVFMQEDPAVRPGDDRRDRYYLWGVAQGSITLLKFAKKCRPVKVRDLN
jgi:hypothetical protein